MSKVKFFAGYGAEEVQNSINQFFAKNTSYEITSMAYATHPTMLYCLWVSYKEK